MRKRWRWAALFVALIVGLASVVYANDFYNGYQIVTLLLDGRQVRSDVPAIIMDGRTLLPVRALSEAMGHDVAWDGDHWTVSLTTQPRLDSAQTASGIQMSVLGVKQVNAPEGADPAMAGRVVTTVRFVNRAGADQTVDLSLLRLEESAGSNGRRAFVVPHVLETSGRQPAKGTTLVTLAKGEEVTATLAYDMAASDATTAKTYSMVLVNAAGEPQAALRIKVTVTIDCSRRPCTITIEIRF
jgi:hypothetical protein